MIVETHAVLPEVKEYIPAELTDVERARFLISEKDGLPFRFPQVWALSERCIRKGEDQFCPDVLSEMDALVKNWPIEDTYDSDGAMYADGTEIPD